MAKIKTLIVDDEPLARKGLAVRLSDYPDLELIGECSNGQQALTRINQDQPDLVFLDIQMPGMNGFQLIQQLSQQDAAMPLIVFITAYDNYAIRAFDVHALDYILKPLDDKRLAEAVEKVREYRKLQVEEVHKNKLASLLSNVTGVDCEEILQSLAHGSPVKTSPYPAILAIKDGTETSRVDVAKIRWIDAAGDYMCVHVGSDTHILRRTMKELEQQLDPKVFVRVHRSAIVNINFVSKLVSHVSGEYHLVLDCGTELKVSRSHRDQVKKMIGA